MTVAAARALFDRRVAAWLAADREAYLDCWHDDLVLELPGDAAAVRGRAAYATLLEASFRWARPRTFDVHHFALDRDVVLAEWTITATRARDDVVVGWSGMNAALLRDDRIAWWREYHRTRPGPLPGA